MFKRILFVLSLILPSVCNANSVTRVYTCGNDIGIEVENVGWYVALESQLGEKRVDRILSIVLTLLATQAPIGYTNPKDAIRWCGIEGVRPISVIQATRN